MRRRGRRYRRLIREAPLLVEVAAALTIARLVVLVPFRHSARLVGRRGVVEPSPLAPETAELAKRVGWAVEALSRRAPGVAVCLPQAMAAKWCLQRRGVRCTLHLGVLRRADDGRVAAHAWLTCGDLVITGSGARPASTPLAAFT